MGMTIDEHIAQLKKLKSFHNGSYGASINLAIETMRKYQILQAEYENRLKADMVAMLDKIRAEIEKRSYYDTMIIGNYEDEMRINLVELDDVNEIIQQKINTLKEQRDEKK